MKTNSIKRIVVSTMALAMGAALVGSISGTVAWYQYSTRATAAFIGSSAHCTHSLEVSVDGSNWATELSSSEIIAAATNHNGSRFSPVTPGAETKSGAALPSTMYGNPSYGYFEYSKWAAADENAYLQFDLYFRVVDHDGKTTPTYLAEDLYFTDITIGAHGTTGGITADDFDESIRIFIADADSAANNLMLAKVAGDTVLGAKLDLNNDGEYDKTGKYEWDDREALEYGDKNVKETAAAWSTYTADGSNAALDATGATKLGTTKASSTALHLTFTIWMEGWAKLDNGVTGNKETTDTSVWDVASYIGGFHVGMEFGVGQHSFH